MTDNSEENIASEDLSDNAEMERKKEIIKAKISKLFKHKYAFYMALLLLFSFIVRLYFFSLTKDQALWWDEAEYGLKAKSIFLGTPVSGWAPEREIVVPFIWGLIYFFIQSETPLRLLQVLISASIVLVTYLLGKELYDEKVGFFAAVIVAVNAVMLFFTSRLLVYLWAPLFFSLTFYFFYKGYIKKEKKYLYLTPVIAGLGISVYGSLAFGVIAIAIFLLITERHKIFIKKEIWSMGALGIVSLIPQFIYNYASYGNIFARWTAFHATQQPQGDFSYIFGYYKIFPHTFGNIFTIIIIAGAIYLLLNLIIYFDILLKGNSLNLKSNLLVLLWPLGVISFYTYSAIYYGGVIYDAFIMSAFPALAVIGANGLLLLGKLKTNKKVLNYLMIFIILLGSFYQISYANSLITEKVDSYQQVREAGLWIKANTPEDAKIVSRSLPQNTYYSERETYPTNGPSSPEDLASRLKEVEADYYVLSIFETPNPVESEIIQRYPNAFVPVSVYYADAAKTQAILVIYQVDVSKL